MGVISIPTTTPTCATIEIASERNQQPREGVHDVATNEHPSIQPEKTSGEEQGMSRSTTAPLKDENKNEEGKLRTCQAWIL